MNTKKNKKAGFTLVELMVVAIIVAILAAVAIPLMTGNKDRAAATEGQAGISTVSTALRVALAENGSYPAGSSDVTTLSGINPNDLDGTYFDTGNYGWTLVAATTGPGGYEITATGNAGPANGKTVIFDSTAAAGSQWSGTLLGDVVTTP